MNQRKAREQRRQAAAAAPPARQSRGRSILLAVVGTAAVATLVTVGVIAARNTGPAQAVGLSDARSVSFAGVDPVTGKDVALADYAGKPVVINVWGSWCEGCEAEAADLQTFIERHPEAQMIGVDLQDSKEAAKAFYVRHGWSHPGVFDPRGEISSPLGIQGTPTTFFLDTKHRIVTQIVGATDLQGFERGLEAALAS